MAALKRDITGPVDINGPYHFQKPLIVATARISRINTLKSVLRVLHELERSLSSLLLSLPVSWANASSGRATSIGLGVANLMELTASSFYAHLLQQSRTVSNLQAVELFLLLF
jgi:hypothetical protein